MADANAALMEADDVGPAQGPTAVAMRSPDALSVLIERAARDTAFPLDRLERLITMQRESEEYRLKRKREDEARVAKQAYEQAAALAQAEMVPIIKDLDNAQTKSKYASYAAIDEAIRPIYTAHGFNQRFKPLAGAPPDFLRLCLIVTHNGGHSDESILDVPADGKGPKGGEVMTRTHAQSSAISYGMRDLSRMAWNLATKKASDDDGNAAGRAPPITEEQVSKLQLEIVGTNADLEKFLRYFKIEKLGDMPTTRFDEAMNLLADRRSKTQ